MTKCSCKIFPRKNKRNHFHCLVASVVCNFIKSIFFGIQYERKTCIRFSWSPKQLAITILLKTTKYYQLNTMLQICFVLHDSCFNYYISYTMRCENIISHNYALMHSYLIISIIISDNCALCMENICKCNKDYFSHCVIFNVILSRITLL